MTTETLQKDPPQIGAEVTITIDNKNFTVHRGSKTVAELKQLAGISPSYELEEIIDGKLVPLKDDQHVKGGSASSAIREPELRPNGLRGSLPGTAPSSA